MLTPPDDTLVLRHAVRAFSEACELEARGECARAVGLYKAAFALERALDRDEADWPAWLVGALDACERATDAPLAPLEPARHVELAPARVDPADVCRQLARRHYACVDGLIGAELAAAVGEEIRRAHATGAMAPGEVAGRGAACVAAKRRGDWVAHVRSADAGWAALRAACAEVERLVARLRPAVAIGRASRPMATRYADGARYAMHYDNDCVDAPPHAAPCANERRLTCVLYASLGDWRPGDGGELRIYRTNRTGSPDERHALVRAEIAPVGGRLVLFWSDFRCPHEVLGAWAERLAVTLWFGRTPAPALGDR
ncbi:hypothetical protein KFE25_012365 [Diacronema lutheri]|uniref:Fe2OG dioxygenase domain-containing protein n=1 Tax=Diacronema lutheri TaxID=2081491 RepID=A0A8J5XN83_DIALT|nr:hypothetical protein KFE25_012365 [Diacronema lutheri]